VDCSTTLAPGDHHEQNPNRAEAVPDAELARRAEILRRAKEAVGGRALSDAEMDRLLPPVECRRTRMRLMRRT